MRQRCSNAMPQLSTLQKRDAATLYQYLDAVPTLLRQSCTNMMMHQQNAASPRLRRFDATIMLCQRAQRDAAPSHQRDDAPARCANAVRHRKAAPTRCQNAQQCIVRCCNASLVPSNATSTCCASVILNQCEAAMMHRCNTAMPRPSYCDHVCLNNAAPNAMIQY